MSYCQIIFFKDGIPNESLEFQNAWGGAARIWSSLFTRYLKDPYKEYDTWVTCKHDGLWKLARRSDLPLFERAVHASTFDLAYVRRCHFPKFSDHLREFVKTYPIVGSVDHLSAWADVIDKTEAEAIGFRATSVSENLWSKYDEDKDEETPVPLSKGFEVYEWIQFMTDSTPANEGAAPPADAKPPRKPRAKKEKIIHGKDCPKAPHESPGMLHSIDDDSPYTVDGVTYCGRCHEYIPSNDKPKHPVIFEDIQAPYVFSPEEIAQMNVDLRHKLNDIDALEDQKKSSQQDFNLRITNAENEAKRLRNKLDSGEETRPVRAIVEFEVSRGKKRLIHPQTKEFIREENMTPADYQLPMFKPAKDGSETVAPKGDVDVREKIKEEYKDKAPYTMEEINSAKEYRTNLYMAGTTSVDAKLTQAAAATETPKLKLDLTEEYSHNGLIASFEVAARNAGWFETQVAVIRTQLKLCDSVERMLDILRPHTVAPVIENKTLE